MQGVFDQGKLNPDQDSYSETKQRQQIFGINDTKYEGVNKDKVMNNRICGDDEEEEEEEEEFSFMCGADHNSPIAAEDAFVKGQMKPVFPLFNMDSYELVKPPVNKVFVETNERGVEDEIIGPYCEWSSRKVVEVETSSEDCKKSNSTGFSKIWRFKDLMGRSNSDGKDAFVFLNKDYNVERRKDPPGGKVEKRDPTVEIAGKAKKASKSKMSAHEVYLRSKAKEEERRRYRPEVVGFFTNVNGGLSKNVHPF